MDGGGRPVLVGVGGDQAMDEVVAWGAREALLRRHPLRLVHAYTLPPSADTRFSTGAARQAHKDAVRRLGTQRSYARQLLPGVPVEMVVRTGGRAQVLLQEARGAELLVVGAGAGWRTGEPAGTLAAQLAGHATQPLLMVREGGGPVGSEAGRIVVGLSDAEGADTLLIAAFAEADLRHRGVLVVHAQGTDGHHGCRPGGERMLAEALAGWRQKYPHVEVEQRLSPTNAAAALVAASRGAELLVVGDRGAGGFAGLRLGSVSDAALRHAACPVLVVPVAGARAEA